VAGEEQGVQDKIDLYFSTFAKSMASIGAFMAGETRAHHSTISGIIPGAQIFAKSLPMPVTIGNLKRLEMLRTQPELRKKLWDVVNKLQKGLRGQRI